MVPFELLIGEIIGLLCLEHGDITNIRDLKFKLYVYSLYKPSNRIYRIKLVDSSTTPVQNEHNKYDEIIERIINTANCYAQLIENLDKKLRLSKKQNDGNKSLTISKTILSPRIH
ncbi:721_t:CDS:2 [Entrophospora sp. SA101]|nr:721_t:CDS:2 [Entrophospora sp. SA101]